MKDNRKNININRIIDAEKGFSKRLHAGKSLIDADWFLLVLDNSPFPMMALKTIRDGKGKIVDLEYIFANNEALSSMQKGSMVGQLFSKQFPGENNSGLLSIYRKVIETGETWEENIPMDGNEKGFKVQALPIDNESLFVSYIPQTDDSRKAKPLGKSRLTNEAHQVFIQQSKGGGEGGSVINVSELNRKLKEINHELSVTSAELNTFASVAAHDYSEMLKNLYLTLEHIINHDSQNLSNTGRANLRRAQSSLQKMKLLTDDMVSYVRLQQLETKVEAINWGAIIDRVVTEANRKFNTVAIEHDCSDLPPMAGYPLLISMLFKQLVESAVRSRKENGLAKVRIDCKRSVRLDRNSGGSPTKDKEYHLISVHDEGNGFTEEEKHKLFEVFYSPPSQVRAKGNSIGLAICKKIMEMHDGFITVETEPDNGAAFHCYFPA